MGMCRYQRCEVRKDCLVSHACRFSMARPVHELDVVQKQVNLVRHAQQVLPVSHPTGLDRSRYAFVLTGIEQASQKCRLHEGLATRKRDATTRLIEEHAGPNERAHHLCHRHDPAHNHPGPGETSIDTASTCGTRVSGPRYSTLQDCRARRACRQTIPVSYTHLRAHETRHDLVC